MLLSIIFFPLLVRINSELGVMAHSCSLSTWETEARGL